MKFISWKTLLYLLAILTFTLPSGWAWAQEGEATGPIYIVQEGDSLWDIALRFRVSMEDLTRVNGITNPNQLTVGSRLIIPGLQGVQGILTTKDVTFGDNLRGLSRRYGVAQDLLVRLNHLTTPTELYAGASLVIPEVEAGVSTKRAMLTNGLSLLELAIVNRTTTWNYINTNHLPGSWGALPGDVLHLSDPTNSGSTDEPSALPGEISRIRIEPSPLVQGKVAVINIEGQTGASFGGSLNERSLNIFENEPGNYIGLQGIHAMVEPSFYTMVLTGTLKANNNGPAGTFSFSQAVLITSGNYYFDPVLIVSPETIDPAVTQPEDAIWSALAGPVTPMKLWDGIFESPAPAPFHDCWPSLFGSRRSYNGSAYIYFHTGLDFCGGVGTKILAPAAGEVIFAGPLTVRGNATMINHGWGVYSGYMHQSEINVSVGERVELGQVIGLVGGTGRVTGPHLHWEIWVGGVQVDPLDWLENIFP